MDENKERSYYLMNRDAILCKAKDYYAKNKGKISKGAKNKYNNLSEEQKNIKRVYSRNRYHKFNEIKTKMKDYAKNRYHLMNEVYKSMQMSTLVNH